MNAVRKQPGLPPAGASEGRCLLIGAQWDAGCWARAPLLIDRILRLLHTVPLHWNFPAFPDADDGDSPAVPVLRERLASAGDSLLAMGCTGACQPALALDELDREIAWGLRNPWSTGLADVFGRRPACLVPRLADLDRPGAAALCLRHGLALVGTAADGPLTFVAHYGLRVFPYARLPLPGQDRQALDAALRRLLASEGDRFVMIDIAALPPSPAGAMPLIETFAERLLGCGRKVLALGQAAREAGEQQPAGGRALLDPSEWRLFPVASLRRRMEAAAPLRRKRRRRSDEQRELIARFSAATPDPPVPPSAGTRTHTDRGLIAHMQGEATLTGDTFDVRLAGGRFSGLARDRVAFTPARPAGSWLRAGGRTIAARGRSAFSFEGDDGTGLREDLALEPGGAIVVDYTFRGEQPFLAIEVAWTLPSLPPATIVEEWAPLVLSLADAPRGGEVPVAVEAPDGSTGTCLVAERDGWRPAAGSVFRVKAGGTEIVLSTGSGDQPAWGLFLFRIAKGRPGRRVLEVSPFGVIGPTPVGPLSGPHEASAFTIGLGRP